MATASGVVANHSLPLVSRHPFGSLDTGHHVRVREPLRALAGHVPAACLLRVRHVSSSRDEGGFEPFLLDPSARSPRIRAEEAGTTAARAAT